MTRLLKKIAIILGSLIIEGFVTIWIMYAAFDCGFNPTRVAYYGYNACQKGFWMVLIIGILGSTICNCWATISLLRMENIEKIKKLA